MDKFNEELKNATNPWIKRIGEYLLTRDDLKDNLSKENKTLSECFDYVLIELSKKAKRNNGVGYVAGDDAEIYELAVHYFDEDDIEVGKKNFETNADGSADASMLIENSQNSDGQDKVDIQQKIDLEVAKALDRYKKEQQEKLQKQKAAKKAKKLSNNVDANQLNLFDL